MNRIIKTLICSLLTLIIGISIGACVSTVNADQEYPLKIWKQNRNGYMNTWHVIDDDTGVNYIVVSTERGNGEMTCAITPRLHADGSLYTTK